MVKIKLLEEYDIKNNDDDIKKVEMTDYARISGGYIDQNGKGREFYNTSISSDFMTDSMVAISKLDEHYSRAQEKEYKNAGCANDRTIGFRFLVEYSKDDLDSIINKETKIEENEKGQRIIKLGTYPKNAISKEDAYKIEELYKQGKLKETGNEFTRDSREYYETNKKIEEQKDKEYEFNGDKYVRVLVKENLLDEIPLTNGEIYKAGDNVWIKVEDIRLVELKNDKNELIQFVPDKLIGAGIQFDNSDEYKHRNPELKKYLNKYLIPEILQDDRVNAKEETIKDKIGREFKNLGINIKTKINQFGNEFNDVIKEKDSREDNER